MLPFPSFLTPAQLGIAAVNRLLRRQPWAQERLQGHSGKTLAFDLGSRRTVRLTISVAGGLQQSDPAIVPDVRFILPDDHFSRVPSTWREGGGKALVGLMQIQGDAGLAQVVADLAAGLRYDPEDELADIVGDVAAVRLVSAMRGLHRGVRTAARRAAENVSEFLVYEQPELVDHAVAGVFRSRLHEVHERLQVLEQSVGQLEHYGTGGGRVGP